MMNGFGMFMGLIGVVLYIAVPVAVVFIIMWVYRIKQNSDTQVEQNKEVIQLLRELGE